MLCSVGWLLTADRAEATQKTEKFTGRALLAPIQEATLSAEITAKIKMIDVREGDHVSAGQKLIVFDCETVETDRDKAEADVMAASATRRSRRQLREYKSVSELNLTLAEAEFLRSSAELARAEAHLERCTVKAPFDGFIVEIAANAHESIRPGQPLMHITADAQLKVEVFVPSRWISWLKKGTGFTVSVDETGKTYKAIVRRSVPRIDPASQTIKIIGRIQKHEPALVPGMSGTAHFVPPGQ